MSDQGVELPLEGVAEIGERRPGRPAGALNRKTRVLGDYLRSLTSYRDPALILAEAASRTPEEIATQLGCTKYEAEKLRLGCAEALMPYLHGKMPVELQIEDSRLPVLMIDMGAVTDAAGGGQGGALSIATPWREENQGVSAAEPAKSHGGKSHE